MGPYRKLWFTLIAVLTITFALLGFYGGEVYRKAPPIPGQVVSADGTRLFGRDDILDGQTAWQSIGGMQLGSIWGHGAYQAPDWTADWLHRELTAWLDLAARDAHGKDYAQLSTPEQAALREALKAEYRGNGADAATDTLTVSPRRARAMAQTAAYYDLLFSDAPSQHRTRESYAMKENTLPDPARRAQLTQFFFWTAWAAATERPGQDVTYTNNWPHEPLIGNTPSTENIVWSIVSVVVLLAGIGLLIWAWAFLRGKEEDEPPAPARDPLTTFALTPSQRALGKYVLLVAGLFAFQVLLGGFTAHYTVEGQKFYGVDLSQWFPYSLVRTWHIQAALFWIATGFLAAGLFLAPYVEGHLPGIFSLLLLTPLGILAAGLIWSRLPERIRLSLPAGWEAALLIPVVLAVGAFALWLSPHLETTFFGGDMRLWLSHDLGITYDQRNALIVGLAMGFAVIPNIFSIAEDAIFSVPRSLTYGSLALGATPWQTLTRVVILTASPGIFSALMIGMGRAVGETMIVLMATGNTPVMEMNLFEGMRTLAANVAVEMPESEVGGSHYRVLFLSALVLLTFTFVMNTLAELIRQRLRKKYASL